MNDTEGPTQMTSQQTLDRLINDAEYAVRLAEVRIDCMAPTAPLRYRVEAAARLHRADDELADVRTLEVE